MAISSWKQANKDHVHVSLDYMNCCYEAICDEDPGQRLSQEEKKHTMNEELEAGVAQPFPLRNRIKRTAGHLNQLKKENHYKFKPHFQLLQYLSRDNISADNQDVSLHLSEAHTQ